MFWVEIASKFHRLLPGEWFMRLFNLLVLGLCICTLSLASGADSPRFEKEWLVDGVKRTGIVYVPTSEKNSASPVVFVFHGHGGTANHAARSYAFQTHWPEAIVVYLQGLKTPGKITDPEGKKTGWQHGAGDQSDRDLKFVDVVLKSLKSEYKVDSKQVFSTGHSNGGAFTYLLWGNRASEFSAFAPSAAVSSPIGKSPPAKPVLHVAGENDPLVKYSWQKMSFEALKKVNACESKGADWAKAGDLVGTLYPSTKNAPVVTLIHPGDHTFHAEAPKLITKFFKEQAKP
jgi:polyhydroxybutyrate depolymerase